MKDGTKYLAVFMKQAPGVTTMKTFLPSWKQYVKKVWCWLSNVTIQETVEVIESRVSGSDMEDMEPRIEKEKLLLNQERRQTGRIVRPFCWFSYLPKCIKIPPWIPPDCPVSIVH